MADLYGVLGVNRAASSNEIKSAFRRLARQLHPDVNADPAAAAKFSQINDAYHVLIDPDRRRSYDRTGRTTEAGSRTQSQAARAARRAYYQQRADRIVNEWIERERMETRARGKAVYTTVTLFVSTFIVAMTPSTFETRSILGRIAVVLLFAVGVRHLFTSLREHFDHYTYKPLPGTRERTKKPVDKPFKRSVAWTFVIGGYLLSLLMGLLIGALTDGSGVADVFYVILLYPPIAVLIVDTINLIYLKLES